MYEDDTNDDSNVIFRDVVFLVAIGFIILAILVLPWINPPKKDEAQEVRNPGNIIVEVIWPTGNGVDVDTWIQDPTGEKVGYSNKSGSLFNLLRDDLGNTGDVTNLNYEHAFSRGIIPGRYVINIHLFSLSAGRVPVKVRAVISIKASDNATVQQFYAADITLYSNREEQTVAAFEINENRTVDVKSISSLYEPIVGVTSTTTFTRPPGLNATPQEAP